MNPFRFHFCYFPIGILFFTALLYSVSGCQEPSSEQKENVSSPEPQMPKAASVAVLGTFHFGGSSGDLASMHFKEPFGKQRQAEIRELVTLLAEFKPTKILVEYPVHKAERLQERFQKYLSGEDSLTVNEIDQVGFRLAQQLGHERLYPIDYQLDLPGDDLVAYCQKHNKMNEFEAFIQGIQDYVEKEDQVLDTMALPDYLARTNTDEFDRESNEAYIGHTLSWGDSDGEAGAHFAATWWERNFVILKNIAATLENKDDRLLVIIGSAHRAVLKDLILDRSDMEYVEIADYLR